MEWKWHVIFFLVAASTVQCAEECPPEKTQPSSEAVPETGSEPSDASASAGTSPSGDKGPLVGQSPTSQAPTGEGESSGAAAPKAAQQPTDEGEAPRSQDSSDDDEDPQPSTSRAVTGDSTDTEDAAEMDAAWLEGFEEDETFVSDDISRGSSSSSFSINTGSGESTLQVGTDDSDSEEESQPSTSQATTRGPWGQLRAAAAAQARLRRLCNPRKVQALVEEIRHTVLMNINLASAASPHSLLKMASKAGFAGLVHRQACEILNTPPEEGHPPFYDHPVFRRLIRAANFLSMVEAAHPETTEPVTKLRDMLVRLRRRLVKHLSV